jgi:hypothetical protein
MRAMRREWVLDLYNLCLGAFLFASPWLFAMPREATRIDTWMSGLLLVGVSAAAIVAYREWEGWVSLLAGVWMIVAPFALGFIHTPAMHINIAIGCAVVFLTLLELFLVHDGRSSAASTTLR